MSRTISRFALIQVAVIVLGFFALGTTMKMNGYPDSFAGTIRWNPTAVFLREHGGWLLALPTVWTIFASIAQSRDAGIFSNRIALMAGVAIPAMTIAFFIYASVDSYTRPLWIHTS